MKKFETSDSYTEEEVQAFIDDYAKLVDKHGFIISGCGCCGSPFVMALTDEDYSSDEEDLAENIAAENIEHLQENILS